MDAISLLNTFLEFGLANPLVQTAAVTVVRTFFGWAQHALDDNKIDRNEWKELVQTFCRLLPQGLGLSALGIPAAGSLFSDIFVTKLAKVADKKK